MVEKVLEFLEEKNIKELKALLRGFEEPMEVLQVLNELSNKQQAIVFRLLPKDMAVEVFEMLELTLQKELLSGFTDEYAREFIEFLDPDDRVDLLDELPANVAKRLISLLSPQDREVTHMLLGYEPETAGRVMTPEFVSLKKDMTAADALAKVRKVAEEKETIYTLYVVDGTKKLEGVLSFRELFVAEPSAIIADIMSDAIIRVSTDTGQEEVAHTLKDFGLLSVPVVDKEGRIVGIVTIDDAMEIIEEEATEDAFTAAGLADITGKETNRSEVLVKGSLWQIWLVRLPFLMLTLLAGLGAGFIMGGFEEILESIVMVAFFIPVVLDMGGSVGTQSTTVFARGIALGHIDTRKIWRPLAKEVMVGASMGLIFGTIAGGITFAWQSAVPMLALVVGLSLFITITMAAFFGFLVPWLLIKMRLDQAAGSAPIITSIKDVLGLVVYFSLVMLFMGSMV